MTGINQLLMSDFKLDYLLKEFYNPFHCFHWQLSCFHHISTIIIQVQQLVKLFSNCTLICNKVILLFFFYLFLSWILFYFFQGLQFYLVHYFFTYLVFLQSQNVQLIDRFAHICFLFFYKIKKGITLPTCCLKFWHCEMLSPPFFSSFINVPML